MGRLDLRDEYSATLNTFFHFLALGVITIASGRPFLFPSLGPSAYLMATGEQPREESAYHVIGGHAVAVAAGMIAYTMFGSDISAYVVFDRPNVAFSMELIFLAVSATVAMMLTTVTMLVTKTNHPAACATTLIIALGLMDGLVDGITIVIAVAVLWVVHEQAIAPLSKYYGFQPDTPRE